MTAAAADKELRVQQLQLPARDAAQLLPRLEDALRTTSRPAAMAQHWVVVKQLRLRTPRGASAQALSRQLSTAFAEVLARARPLTDATDHDEVVWATSEADARVQLLTRWMQERPCSDWFWLPVARNAGLHSAQRPQDGMARAQAIVALLTVPTGRADGGAGPARSREATAMATEWWPDAAALFTPAAHGHLAAQVEQHLPAHHQLAWRDALRKGAGAVLSVALSAQDTDTAAGPAEPADHAAEPAQAWPAAKAAPPSPATDAPAVPNAPRAHRAQHRAAAAPPPVTRTQPPGLRDTTLHGQPSAWAGLWLLLPLLRMSGVATAQAEPAHTLALALGLMQRAAERWTLDALCRDWIAAHEAKLQAKVLAEGQAHPVSQPLGAFDIDTAWHSARRHTLAHARLPLQRLLHRPGQVWLAPHRVDVQFPLRSAHIGIRRAGLDIDPGYLPWLDTVVHFHYV